MKYVAVYITARTPKEARRLADILLKERLIACANIIPRIESAYHWKGRIEKHPEALLIGKTKASLKNEILKTVKAHHSYTVPCINFLPVDLGNQDYRKWLEKETKQ